MQSPLHIIDGYGPQDVVEEAMLVVLVDRMEIEVGDIEVCDWLLDLLDAMLLVDFAELGDTPELLDCVGLLVARDGERWREALCTF